MFKWLHKTNKQTAPKSSALDRSPSLGTSARAGAVALPEIINIALQHHQAGRLSEAEAAYREILAVDPENIDALHFSGVIAYQRGENEQAAEWISRALARNASNAPAHNNLGNVLVRQGKLEEAIACYQKALAFQPDYVDAHINLGAAFRARGELDEAVACYQRALSLAPDIPTIHSNLGNLLSDRGKPEEAIACYRKALALQPDFAEAHSNLASILRDQGRPEEAIACYRKALALKPDFAEAHSNLGNVLRDEGRLDEAVDCYRKALALKPDFPEAHFTLGSALEDRGLRDEAIACYRRALALKPDFPEGHSGLGNALRNEGRLDEAIACHRKALALKPDFPEAHFHLGEALREQDRFNEALGHYQKALSLRPDFPEARWFLAMSQIPAVYEADADPGHYRSAFSRELGELERWFNGTRLVKRLNAVGVHQPFYLAYQEENNRSLLQRHGNLCARLMSEWFDRQTFAASPARRDFDGVIRIGIVSHHFRNHSVWNAIIKGWFEQLDRQRFSLHAFYLGLDQDRETLFAQSHASHFEQGGRGLRQWVEAILGQQLDVLIYPGIGMDPITVKLASLRLAPVQVAAWGHPETTGAQGNYTEELVTLPHLGCFYKSPQVVAVDPDLGSLGIGTVSPLLLCPGVPFKYAPQHDGVLTEIARRLGRCRFIFFTHQTRNLSEKLRRRLEIVFARSRLDLGDFVTFIPWQNWPEFYGLLQRADVFLDTIGFSGFNTAMQAVECGLPIVTREGRFLRGRLASGILKRMGLQELVAGSEEDYISLAVRLCQSPEYHSHTRTRIGTNREVLFEDSEPVRALERFLESAIVE